MKRPAAMIGAAALSLLFGAPCVQAHAVTAGIAPFYAGLLHPLVSSEHLLPMLALALLVSQSLPKTGFASLLIFPAALGLGVGGGSALPLFAGAFRVASHTVLVLLGILLLPRGRRSGSLLLTTVVLTGLILGFRSGIDWQGSGVGASFVPGSVLSGLIVMALFAGGFPRADNRLIQAARWLSATFCILVGLAMLSGYWVLDPESIIRGTRWPTEEELKALLQRRSFGPTLWIGAIAGAAVWGAGHALTPGHGKAIVGAYLIGARSTAGHALLLGLTVTITHTLGVFLLGVIALFAARYVLPEQIYPWLSAASGGIVLLLGAVLARQRLLPLWKRTPSAATADHQHGHHGAAHSHLPTPGSHSHSHHLPEGDGVPVTWRSLIGLGISGGLLPCPSALVLLLSAVAVQRTGFGLVLVLAFSGGLAGVLTTVGLLFVKGRRWMRASAPVAALERYVPAASALVIMLIGLGLTVGALQRIVV